MQRKLNIERIVVEIHAAGVWHGGKRENLAKTIQNEKMVHIFPNGPGSL